MISVRRILIGLAVAFTAYLAARGLMLWSGPVNSPALLVGALVVYLPPTLFCILWRSRPAEGAAAVLPTGAPSAPLPLWATVLALICAAAVPNMISVGAGPESLTAPFATWYIGGIGALMTVVMVRRRTWFAWVGMAVLTVSASLWMGPVTALQLGLVGSFVWVMVAQLLMGQLDRAARDTTHLAQLQRAASAWQASQTGRQRERRVQVQRALSVAGPVLTRTVATGGRLTDEERLAARVAEGALRDQMRGPRLLDDDVRRELDAARRRGATVTVLDEGGLEGLDDASLSIIRGQLAAALQEATSDRLYIRTSPHDEVAVTVVGRSAAGPGLSDEDAVDLWREIAHPR